MLVRMTRQIGILEFSESPKVRPRAWGLGESRDAEGLDQSSGREEGVVGQVLQRTGNSRVCVTYSHVPVDGGMLPGDASFREFVLV